MKTIHILFIVIPLIFGVETSYTWDDKNITHKYVRKFKRYAFRRSQARERACGSRYCK